MIWEIKTDDESIHEKDHEHTWTAASGGTAPDGTAFVAFLATLNGGTWDGTEPDRATACLADKCDWRLPTIEELRSIVEPSSPSYPPPTGCTTIHGERETVHYWSSSTYLDDPTIAPFVDVFQSVVGAESKHLSKRVRAARGAL